MYRLAILTRLRRRFPIQIAKEAISSRLSNGIDLPASPFIDSEGRFLSDDPELTQMVSNADGDDADYHALFEALAERASAIKQQEILTSLPALDKRAFQIIWETLAQMTPMNGPENGQPNGK